MGSSPPENQIGGAKLWMWLNRSGEWKCDEWDNNYIIRHICIHKRFLLTFDSSYSHSCYIFLARDGVMMVQFGFLKAIVTAEELFLLDPLCQEVLPFVEKLKKQFPHNRGDDELELSVTAAAERLFPELPLPFEFQVLKIALEVVCGYLDSNVSHLERVASPLLDKLDVNFSDENLKHVRSLKIDHNRLLVFLTKMLHTIERLLDNNKYMARLYLTRKVIENQKLEDDIEELDILLEEFFIKLKGIHMKMLSLREIVDGKQDCINMVLDDQQKHCKQKKRWLSVANLAVVGCTAVIGILHKNINNDRVFHIAVGICIAGFIFLYMVVIAWLKHKRLLD